MGRNIWILYDEGLTLETSALESLYGGQIIRIKSKYSCSFVGWLISHRHSVGGDAYRCLIFIAENQKPSAT